MIAIGHLALALLVSAAALSGVSLEPHPWLVAGGVAWSAFLWPLLAWPLGRAATARAPWLARAAGRALGVAPVLAQVGAVGLSGWAQSATLAAERLGSPESALVLALAPFALAALASSDAALLAAVRRSAPLPREVVRRARLVGLWHQARVLLVGLVPFALYALIELPVHHHDGLAALVRDEPLAALALSALELGLLAALLPRLVRLGLGLARIRRGALLDVYRDLAARLRFRGRGLFLWRTGGHEVNAAVVGFASWHRFVLVTEGLAVGLPTDEARALLGHELGHTVRRHVPLYAAFSAAVLVPAALLLEHAPEALASQLAAAALLALWFLGVGWLSRRAELEADLVAAECAGGPEPLARLLVRVSSPARRHQHGWRHFSPAQRILFARAAHRQPDTGLRLRRQLERARSWSNAAALLALVALVAATAAA